MEYSGEMEKKWVLNHEKFIQNVPLSHYANMNLEIDTWNKYYLLLPKTAHCY